MFNLTSLAKIALPLALVVSFSACTSQEEMSALRADVTQAMDMARSAQADAAAAKAEAAEAKAMAESALRTAEAADAKADKAFEQSMSK